METRTKRTYLAADWYPSRDPTRTTQTADEVGRLVSRDAFVRRPKEDWERFVPGARMDVYAHSAAGERTVRVYSIHASRNAFTLVEYDHATGGRYKFRSAAGPSLDLSEAIGNLHSVASVEYDTKNPPPVELAVENLKCLLLHTLQELPIETLVDVMRRVSEQAGDPDPAAIARDVCAVTDRFSEDDLTSKLTEIFRPQTADEKPPSGFLAVVKRIFRRPGN